MKWRFPLAALLAATTIGFVPSAKADDVTAKIAICNPLKVMKEIQEYKDIVTKLKADGDALKAQFKDKKEHIAAMQDELKLLVPDSEEYAKKNEDMLKASIETDVWAKMHDMEETRTEKRKTRDMFDKIAAAVAQVAHDRGIVLVISDQHPELPEDMDDIDLQTVRAALMQRPILYSDPKMDITEDVVLAMDKAYNATH